MNRLFALVISASCALGAAAVEIKDVFSAMPDSVLPTLTRNNRLDMVDFIASGMKAEVNDVFDGKVTLDTLTADYLHLTLSEAVKVEMKLLPSSESLADTSDCVVCVVMTYGVKPKESSVRMFTSKWSPLPVPDVFRDGNVAILSPSSTSLTLQPVELIEYREDGEEKQQKDDEFLLTTFKWGGREYNNN
ncbi:MAG: DUF3256 family protein [Prevotella sp.]